MPNYLGSFLSGAAPYAGPWGEQKYKERQFERLPEAVKLEQVAEPEDVTAIKSFMALAPSLTDDDRLKRIKSLKKRISDNSVGYLNYMLKRLEEAPPLTLETWRIGGERAPESARDAIMRLLEGTAPGYEYELPLWQLPESERTKAFEERFGRGVEARYPGAVEVARGMLPKFEAGEPLSPEEAARERARQTPGGWQRVTAVTKGWTPATAAWERERQVSEALGKGLLTERDAMAARTFIDYSVPPDWAEGIADSQLPSFGLSRDENGNLVSKFSTNPAERIMQQSLRALLSTPMEALPDWSEISAARQAQMRAVAVGERELTAEERRAIETDKSRFGEDFLVLIQNPLINYKGTDEYWEAVYSLTPYFSPGEIAIIMSIVENPMMLRGLSRIGRLAE